MVPGGLFFLPVRKKRRVDLSYGIGEEGSRMDETVQEPCETCSATGYLGHFSCRSCGGHGIVQGRREVEISIPAHVSDGTEARLSLEDIGLRGVDLNVLVSIRSN